MTSHRVHFFHVIWSTKGRRDMILPKFKDELYRYMGGVISNTGGTLMEIGGIANHVHVLLEVSNLDKFTPVIRNTKAASTGWLKKQFPECALFAWQDGFGSFTVSYSQLERIRSYIRNQEEHHQNQTFEQEYLKLLKVNEVQFNEKFVFD